MSELRFNPLLGEWVATATHRQDRTFLPPPGSCPLCPTLPGGFQTEIPREHYDIVAFENRFPTFRPVPLEPAIDGTGLYPVVPSNGVCEVVVYSPHHDSSLANESVEQIYRLIHVWQHRFAELDKLEFVQFVFIFENKGEAVGVTLHHPHGQIYGYPMVPPVLLKELDQCRKHMDSTGRCLHCDIVVEEKDFSGRIVAENDSFVTFVPFFARYPYEVHIVSKRHFQAITDLTTGEHRDLAGIFKMVLAAYDRLFDMSLPYIMSMHQRPSDGGDYDHYHFHIEFTPPMRTAVKLKYLAGSESGAGLFINDTLPENSAAELRKLVVQVEWK